ncbi:hypothetical protein NL676_018070 [Syzygium grande]|nr:hypothetical protein NL676_018070 [Syzygium grande]
MVPPWLESLLSTSFSNCPSHYGAPRSECNMYCLDCVVWRLLLLLPIIAPEGPARHPSEYNIRIVQSF